MQFVQLYILSLSLIALFPLSNVYCTEKNAPLQFWFNRFEHENSGCPINSQCTKHMGNKLRRWKTFLEKIQHKKDRIKKLENHRQKYGIPISFWTKQDAFKLFSPVLWDSPCPHHRHKNRSPILIGQAFISQAPQKTQKILLDTRQTYQIDNRQFFALDPVFVQFSDGIQKYQVPIHDIPSHTRGKKLFVLQESLGHYFNILISPQGDWKISELEKSVTFGENIQCPAILEQRALKEFSQDDIHKGFYCKQLFDIENKRFNPMLVSWSCH